MQYDNYQMKQTFRGLWLNIFNGKSEPHVCLLEAKTHTSSRSIISLLCFNFDFKKQQHL